MEIFFIYSCIALPVLTAQYAMYFLCRSAGLLRQSLIPKCTGSFLSAGSVALAFGLRGQDPLDSPILWFVVLCTIADALLEINFIIGMLTFGAAHACLILWFLSMETASLLSLILWILTVLVSLFLFAGELKSLKLMAIPLIIYAGLLGGGVALGVSMLSVIGLRWVAPALGSVMFYISDMLVAKNQLSNQPGKWTKLIMVLYWGALYLISTGAWIVLT